MILGTELYGLVGDTRGALLLLYVSCIVGYARTAVGLEEKRKGKTCTTRRKLTMPKVCKPVVPKEKCVLRIGLI